MTLDPSIIARVQFAFTVSFHIIFPAISIGLGLFLVIIEGLWLKSRNPLYLEIYRFWLKIFALAFGVGVVTGIVLSFEFGLAFAKFGQIAGPVIGALIGWEVLTAFFLEAGFLGIMLFGMQRVGPKLHFFATCMVSLGTQISASWILAANSWMQTPAGATLEGGRFVVHSWLNVIVNPTWPIRLPHMLVAAYLTGAFLIAGCGAWYLLRGRHVEFARKTVSLGVGLATVFIAMQVFLGDILYGTMIQHQPAKMQAAEGFWEKESESPAPYYWIIVPDQAGQRNRVALGTPYLGSIWLTHSLRGRVAGLKNTPQDHQPYMALTFYGFRVMYVTAILMFGVCAASLWLRFKRRLFTTRWFLKALVLMTPAGVIATLGGWYLAETGRQPWVIYGVLRTADAISPVPAPVLLASLVAFVCIYSFFMTGFLIFVLRIVRRGPGAVTSVSEVVAGGLPGRQSHSPHLVIWRPLGQRSRPGSDAMDFPLLSALFAAFALTLYVLLDGFDLGVGALLLLQRDGRLRDQMVDSIAPTWDGNETWFVMAAIALFAGFPIAYGILLPALYLPLIVMLLALGIRGVTFEFRIQSRSSRRAWDTAFGVASVVAALAQGAAAGTALLGVQVAGDRFGGSVFDALNPVALVTGCALLAAYVMLGAGWLRVKERQGLRAFAGRVLRAVGPLFVILVVAAWIAAATVQPDLRSRFAEHWLGLSLILILLIGGAVAALRSVSGESDLKPFAIGSGQCALAALAAWLIVYPDVVPFRVSLWSAASAPPSHAFLLTGAALVTPVVLAYSAFAYRVFRGKTPAGGLES